MFPTKHDLPEGARRSVIDLLNARLADALDLQLQLKQAHWNVKGPNFIGLHELFDKISGEVQEYVDDLAERVVQLGGVAMGTARVVAARSSLPEFPLQIADGRSHVDAVATAIALVGKAMRTAIRQADAMGDLDAANLITGISRGLDKALWFVEAHAQADR